jgi:hypothetical protein
MLKAVAEMFKKLIARAGFATVTFYSALVFSPVAWGLEAVVGDVQKINDSRTTELVVWQRADNPDVFIFDFPNLTAQGRSFNRVMQQKEQQGVEAYPRVLNNLELAKHIAAVQRTSADFAFGHDILVSEFVQFFNLADRDKIELNPEEITLRDFLISQGLIKVWRGIYQSLRPNVVILSIPQVQEKRENEPKILAKSRFAILSHEMAHAEFFTNTAYAAYCRRFWSDTLNNEQRALFIKFLTNYNYRSLSDELTINETQAYLMFTPDEASFSAKKLGLKDEELEAMRNEFRKGRPPTLLSLGVRE